MVFTGAKYDNIPSNKPAWQQRKPVVIWSYVKQCCMQAIRQKEYKKKQLCVVPHH